jgi:hypothetical protein
MHGHGVASQLAAELDSLTAQVHTLAHSACTATILGEMGLCTVEVFPVSAIVELCANNAKPREACVTVEDVYSAVRLRSDVLVLRDTGLT